MRQIGLKLWFGFFVSCSFFILTAGAEEPRFQQLGHSQLPSGSTLAFGLSANPATFEHMGILARLMTRFGFEEARLLPTMPYKANGGSPEQVLDIATVAVKHLDEVLDSNGIAYQPEATQHSTSFAWNDKDHKFELQLDAYDIEHKNVSNTLKTLNHLVAQKNGDAKKVFWVSGGDSFASVPTWMPNWKDLFNQANWVVISRPGYTENGVDFHSTNPLSKIYDVEFLSHYNYTFDPENQVHNYVNKDSSKPNIYVVSQPVLNYSSSIARASFAAKDHHHIAQAGLQPSVFRHCLEMGYYNSQSDSDYRAFTEVNLGIYLKHILFKLETQSGASRKAWQNEYQNLSKKLISILLDETRRPLISRKTFSDRVTAFIHGADELVESLPRSTKSQEIKMLSGDKKLYTSLNELRNKLLRGNPDLIFSRTTEFGLGLEGQAIELNLIRSRLPSWLPLWVRNYDNAHVKWHDLNISTNEMVAILRNPKLAKLIKRVAGKDHTIHTTLLRQAIENSSRALTRFRVFAAARYFKRIAVGDISPEILEGFSPVERTTIRRLREQHLGLSENLSPLEIEHYTEALSQIYALTRILNLEPHKINDVTFWHHYRDLLATGYPGVLYNANHTKQRETLNSLIPLIEFGINRLLKDPLKTQAIKNLEGLLPTHYREYSRSHELSHDRLAHNINRHLTLNPDLFTDTRAHSVAEGKKTFELLPPHAAENETPRGNLVWDIKKLSSQMDREFSTLQKAFDSAFSRLNSQPTHFKARAIFLHAQELLMDQWYKKLKSLKSFEYEVLQAKSTQPYLETESALKNYETFVADLQKHGQELTVTVENLRTLTQLMLGSIGSHLADPYRLRADVAAVLGISQDDDIRRLGMHYDLPDMHSFPGCQQLLVRIE